MFERLSVPRVAVSVAFLLTEEMWLKAKVLILCIISLAHPH